MKTKHEVTLYIDENPYNVIVRDLTKKEAKEISLKGKELDKQRDKYNKKRQALFRVQNQLDLNEEIKARKKVDLAFLEEQKGLFERYYKLSDEVEKLKESVPSDDEIKEEMTKAVLALRVDGKDAKAFCDKCIELNIDIGTILNEILKATKEAEEKK